MASLSALGEVGSDHLAGKVLVDVANPLDFSQGFPPTLSVKDTDSLAEQIQRAFPEARVVKALNTVTASVMVDPASVGDGDTTIFAAGDDAEAREQVGRTASGARLARHRRARRPAERPRAGDVDAAVGAADGCARDRRVQPQARPLSPVRSTIDTAQKHALARVSHMSYLLRVALPDVPGSLGRLASAIGSAGGNIDAIEIVERSHDGRAVDDVFLAAEPGVMPDSIISACTSLEDVEVLWISRYGAGSNLTRDLEVVEAMTSEPGASRGTPWSTCCPPTFVVDWAVRVRREGDGAKVLHGTPAAPTEVPEDIRWPADLTRGSRIEVPERLVGPAGRRVRARRRRDGRHRTPRWTRDPRLRDRAALATSPRWPPRSPADRPSLSPADQVPASAHDRVTAGAPGPPTP